MTLQDPYANPFNPLADGAENDAWAAGLRLSNAPEVPSQPLAPELAGPPAPNDYEAALPGSARSQRSVDQEAYTGWYEHRSAKGLAIFPTAQAVDAQKTQAEMRKAYGGLDTLKDAINPAQFSRLDAAAKGEEDPEEFKARAINAAFFKSLLGKDIPTAALPEIRDHYAHVELGMDGPTTHKAVYSAIQARFKEEDASQVALAKIAGDTSEAILTGQPVDPGVFAKFKDSLPPRLQNSAAQSYLDATREARAAVRRNKPLVDKIEQFTAHMRDAEDPGESMWRNIGALTDMLPDDPRERAIALGQLQHRWQAVPEDQRGLVARIWDSAQRGTDSAFSTIGDYGRANAAGLLQSLPGSTGWSGNRGTVAPDGKRDLTNDPNGFQNQFDWTSDANQKHNDKLYELMGVLTTEGMKIKRKDDGWLAKGLINAGPSAWMMPAAVSGWGMLAINASMAGTSYMDARQKTPGADPARQLTAATSSGIVQGALETIFDTTGFKMMTGKLPTLTRLLNLTGVENRAGRLALGAAAGMGSTLAGEYTEEALQSGTDMLFQAAATDLSGLRSDVDWKQWAHDWTHPFSSSSTEQADTLSAILPYALLAAGGAGIHHFKAGSESIKNRAVLRAHGLNEVEIRQVIAAPTAEASAEALRTGFDAAQQRIADDPAQQEKLAQYKAAAIADLRASNEALAKAGMPRVEVEHNDFTGEDQWIFSNPADGSRRAYDSEAEAFDAWHGTLSQQHEEDLDQLAGAAESGFIEHVMGEGQQAASGVQVIDNPKELSLAAQQKQTADELAAAREAERKARKPAALRAAQDRLQVAQTRMNWLKSRIEVFILDQGLSAEAAADTLKNTYIRGRVFANRVADRVAGYTVELFAGRSIHDVIEEFAEVNIRDGMDAGMVDPEILLDDIRRYEAASGARVIAQGYEYSPENPISLIEGFSKLARGYALSQVRSGLLPATVAKWLEMQTAIASSTITNGSALAHDVKTAGELRAAMAAGHLPPRLRSQIADSIGINETERAARLQKAMEEQLAAEAMGGFPEVSDALRGKLPHPRTAAKEGMPLAGELRRIWESLVRPTSRRTKTGRAIDRTNEANAFFLPEGQSEGLDLIRRSINQQGFDFSTPADMLDALDQSVSYNKPHYGTASHAGETFSLGTGRPAYASMAVQALRHDKTAWQESGYGMAGAVEIVNKYYKTAAFAGIPKDAVLVAVPSTSGNNVIPAALATRISKDFGNVVEDRPAGLALAAGEAKNKRTFFDKESDPVAFEPVPEVIAALKAQGRPVYVTEDVHNTGESWIAFVRMLQANGLEVAGVAALASTEQRMTSPRDIERMAEKVAGHLGMSLDEVLGPLQSLFTGTFKQLANKAENDITNSKAKAARLIEIATSGRRSGAYSNPLPGGEESSGGSTGVLRKGGNQDSGTNLFGESWSLTGPQEGESFSLSHKSIIRLEEAIARKLNQGPEERAAYYGKLRDRLASTVLMLRESKRNLALDQTDAERERNRIRDGLAEAKAIIAALPAEARGRVSFPITDILEADTERGQTQALIRLIDQADSALETVLLKEYREAFENLLDLAKPDLRQNKQLKGRLTPEAQRLVGMVLNAVTLDPVQLGTAIVAAEAEVMDTENPQETPTTPEAIAAAQKALIEATQKLHILETYGAFSHLNAERAAHAYENLLGIYTTARTTRKIMDEAKRADLSAARQEVLDSLPPTEQSKHKDRMDDKGLRDLGEAWRLGLSSFHQVMEWMFPRSQVARDFQVRVRQADRQFTAARIAARERFEAFTNAAWNLSGRGISRRRNRIIAELSITRKDWGVQLAEGVASKEEKLSEEQAAAILAGTMKTGWETDPMAMLSLQQALADFRLQRLKAQNEDKRFSSKVIRFQRLTHRGAAGPLHMSNLDVLYVCQLYAQEEYRPALDKYGFTGKVMETLTNKLDPRAADLGDFLRSEYDAEWDRLNPVYRSRYGMDMPKIRNYAPGQFQHNGAQSGGSMTPDGASPPVSAMAAGFTKARTHHMARPETANAMAAYWSHLEATEYFIAYADVMGDARSIFRSPEVRRRLESEYGERATNLFHQWLDALELDGNFRAADVLAEKQVVQHLLNAQAAIGLAFNVGVLFKQAGATLGAMLEMTHKDAVHGLMEVIANPAMLKSVWNSEAVQQRILTGISPEDRMLLSAANASPSRIMELLDIGRLPIAYADAAFTTLGASLAYSHARAQAIASGLSGAAADQHALAVCTRVIERTAQPSTTQDKSMSELTKKGFCKFLFLFKSDPRQKLAIAMGAIQDLRRGTMTKRKAARKLCYSWIAYGISAQLMSDAWQAMSRDKDDPERWSWRDYLAAGMVGPLNGVPLFGSAIDYITHAVVGSRGFTNSISPIDQGAANAIKLTNRIRRMVSDDKPLNLQDYMNASVQITSAVALVLGGIYPRAAVVPAVLRLLRDTEGLLANAVDSVTPETPEHAAMQIISTIQSEQKSAAAEATKNLDAQAKELAKLDTATRSARLAGMPTDQRGAMIRRLRKAEMSASEQALAHLSKDARKTAVEKITAAMTPAQAERYLERLKVLELTE